MHRRENGQALVEFALIIVLLLTFLFVIIEAGRVFQAWQTVQNSARSAARYALTGQYNDTGIFNYPDCIPEPVPSRWQVCSVQDEALRTAAGLNIDPAAGPTDPKAFVTTVFHFVEITSTGKLTNTEGVGPPGKPTGVQVYYNVEVVTPFLRVIADNIRVSGQVEVVTEKYDQITPGDIGGSTVSDNPPSPPLPTEVDIVVNKRGPTDQVYVDETVTYYIDVENTGDFGVPNVEVIDILPMDTIVDPLPTWTVTSNGDPVDLATCVIDPGAREIDCVIPFLDIGQLATVSVDLALDPLVFNDASPPESVYVTNTVEVFNQTKTLDPDLTNNESFTVTQVKPWADFELRKTGFPSTVILGDEVRHEIIVGNAGPNTGSGAVISDTIPPGLSVISYTLDNGSCDLIGLPVISCVLGQLGRAEQATLNIYATAVQSGTWENTAEVSDSDLIDMDMGTYLNLNSNVPDQIDSTVTKILAPKLVVTKTGPSGVLTGTPITFTIEAFNAGNAAATSVYFTDTMSLGPTVNVSGIWSVSPPCAQTGSGQQFSCLLPSPLGINESVSFTFVVTPTLDNNSSTAIFTNTIDISSNSGLENATDNHTVLINRVFDLEVTKIGLDSVFVDDQLFYTVTVTNNGPSTVNNFFIEDRFVTGIQTDNLEINNCPSTLSTYPDGFTCKVPKLDPSENLVLTFNIDALSDGKITNTATVTDTFGTENTSVDTDVLPVAELALSLTNSSLPVSGTITYTFEIVNNGPSAAADISVTNIITGNMGAITITNSSGVCGSAAGAITGTIVSCLITSSLPALTSESFIVAFSYITDTQIIADVLVSSETFDPDIANNDYSISDFVLYANKNLFLVDLPSHSNSVVFNLRSKNRYFS